MQKTEMNWSMF